MRTILVTGTDTGVGKTQVVATLARLLTSDGARVQIVKPVETGCTSEVDGDAARAARLAGVTGVDAYRLDGFAAPIAPLAAAQKEGRSISVETWAERIENLPECDWRVIEGAGGIAVPLDDTGRDWVDAARWFKADVVILVVPDRLGAINQARLGAAYAENGGVGVGVWLNATETVEPDVAASNRAGLAAAGLDVWATQSHGAVEPNDFETVRTRLAKFSPRAAVAKRPSDKNPAGESPVMIRSRAALAEREALGLRRTLCVFAPEDGMLNLADNDYLDLGRDPVIAAAVTRAAVEHGTSASASPLITGWREPHARLVETLCAWHGLPHGLLWSSGYAANAAILGVLPHKGDLILADRLIHHSMVAGALRSGARIKRYPHLDLVALEHELTQAEPGRTVFVVTESVFSMDGDYPDLVRMAALKRRYDFFWIVDEAHALGWYGPEGAGLVRAAGLETEVDVLVGTCGKALASGGAYSLFNTSAVRGALMNFAGEFIYSTGLPPTSVAAADAAVGRIRELATDQTLWRARSRAFRAALRADGWDAKDGDSPIVPVKLGAPGTASSLVATLRNAGIIAAAMRPPTVPEGTSRVRFSLKRTFDETECARVLAAMRAWRTAS